jgi:hypothetical protein
LLDTEDHLEDLLGTESF